MDEQGLTFDLDLKLSHGKFVENTIFLAFHHKNISASTHKFAVIGCSGMWTLIFNKGHFNQKSEVFS